MQPGRIEPDILGPWRLENDTTLARILAANADAHPDDVALRHKDRGIWKERSWSQWLDDVLACAAAFEQAGLRSQERVLIIGDNRPRLYTAMLAAMALSAYPMPAYPDATPDEILHFLQSASIRIAVAADQEQVDKLLDLRSRGSLIETIVYDDPRGLHAYRQPGLRTWSDLESSGRDRLASTPALRSELIGRAVPDGPAIFLHSSGTTGSPKGIVLSHRNLLSAVASGVRASAFSFKDSVLAYLPMAWVGDFAMSMAAGIALRFQINIPERQETVAHDLREIAPTLYLAAPRSWDNMLSASRVRMEDSTWLKKKLYAFFLDRALRVERRKLEGKGVSLPDRVLRAVGEVVIFGPIKDQLGLSRVRNAFTGGEAIGEDTFLFYRALGVQLRQVYGQTENCGFAAMQSSNEVRLHTVGKPMPDVEVRISEEGEVLVKADSVFSAYLEHEEATSRAFQGGMLRTGDAGFIEPDGHLVVLGRLSDVVHTAHGERYIPHYIENRLKFSPHIKDAAVFGRGRDTLGAILCIDRETVGHWAETRGLAYVSYADLSQNSAVIDLMRQAVASVNTVLPEALRLRHFVCLHKEFDADDGEITRTRKLRRNVIEERYAPLIDAVYQGRKEVVIQAKITYETGESGTLERTLSIQRL